MTHPPTAEIEAAARALIGDEQYDAMPDRATYRGRKWTVPTSLEWYDRQDLHADIEAALKAAMAVRREGE